MWWAHSEPIMDMSKGSSQSQECVRWQMSRGSFMGNCIQHTLFLLLSLSFYTHIHTFKHTQGEGERGRWGQRSSWLSSPLHSGRNYCQVRGGSGFEWPQRLCRPIKNLLAAQITPGRKWHQKEREGERGDGLQEQPRESRTWSEVLLSIKIARDDVMNHMRIRLGGLVLLIALARLNTNPRSTKSKT